MKRVPKTPSKSTGQVRIISGQWRGRKLPVADVIGLRPTTDRTKETLFNWLMHDIANARCLDMFAGSGGLGFEALSRYAQHVTFVEADKNVARNLTKNLTTLGGKGTVVQGDALTVLTQLNTRFDIIFIDPPFNQGLVQTAIDIIVSKDLLNTGGLIYIEQEGELPLPTLPSDYSVLKEKKTKAFTYQLVKKTSSASV